MCDREQEIIRAIKDGEVERFADLIRCYEPRLRQFVRQYLTAYRLEDLVDDMVQETFLKAFHSLHAFRDDEAAFSTWLFTIARNTVLSELRRSRHQDVALDDRLKERLRSPFRPPEETIIVGETAALVRQAIMALPERQRKALVLREYEEMEYRDIADRLGLTVSSVKSLLFRARTTLKEKLEPYIRDGRMEGRRR
ncbi:sigma-70 family RNA polymerase sigma factor [Hydrogenibacillus schlegelii]|uniref:RNA polymerase sigma-70 factor, ECF subfamily n=1 Tax=Hydrogenibacillus schlegelii TaxID=1484 RepID=A0A132NCS8_HYDSH|nr:MULTISPECIES: sigma-70 family RNA polymerase sigma factor [Hydrogenibacillus]KWX07382.1 RNA polymerase sigma24 factor [Hydrogenibacillus schlegelii]MBT9282786.1 sigma-70 family RNA polymerase sigma factor [Hydrogenibacillus schlegelii]OAR03730.1 RNA polymerase subunit sigma-24 [Hydrogenibacillus schlegelii]PTQ52361.1 MAG: RNA polymerase sigma-70 factor, ECF subfamily [Hydrogenibacillus schlegelii]QZA33788.1 sigma-70 family RNA polymerase sigma factor [Hydrogenibacillus sp. N12]